MEERVSTIGDLQLGRVPAGKSSALRTLGGMALIAGQGEARPERILRRFFSGLASIWEHIHELNQQFLTEEKQIRIGGLLKPGENPYMTVTPNDVAGRYQFDFKANVLNTSKMALQESIDAMLGVYVTPLMLQLGIIDAEGIYKLVREFGRSRGQDPDQYLKPPSPAAMKRRIWAEEAISVIFDGQIPDGEPGEVGGAVEHLQKLQEFMQDDRFGLLDEPRTRIFAEYIREVAEKAAMEQQQMQQQAAAGAFAAAQGGGAPGRPAEGLPPSNAQPMVQSGELLDETLPSAGGGANGGV
jgi:hypothetical protein